MLKKKKKHIVTIEVLYYNEDIKLVQLQDFECCAISENRVRYIDGKISIGLLYETDSK